MSRVIGKLGFILLATSVSVTSALAAEIPRYDVESWCKTVAASAGGSSALIYNGCFDQEQDAYSALKQSWGATPDKTRRWCNQVAMSGGSGSYMILKGCMDQETEALQEQSGKKFEY